jgi:hypothetical protein
MQKTYLFSMQIGMPLANALKSLGYTNTVLFLTISKPDISQHKSSGKSATVFYLSDQKLPKLAVNLSNLFCDRYPAYQYPATVHLTNYQYLLQILDALQVAFLFAQEIGKFFALTTLDLLIQLNDNTTEKF